MPRNQGKTSLKRRYTRGNPMRDYDRLPPELRVWLSQAVLPWRAGSVQKAYDRAMARTGDPKRAMAALDALQDSLIAKDAANVWGEDYPLR